MPGSDVLRRRSEDAVHLPLLTAVGEPTGHAADSEDTGEEFGLDAELVQQGRGVELGIRLEVTSRFGLIQQSRGNLFHFEGEQRSLFVQRLEFPVNFSRRNGA